MSASPQTRKLVGALGAALRHNPQQAPTLKRDLRAAQLADHIREVVAAAPPLTDTQRAELAGLLTAGGAR